MDNEKNINYEEDFRTISMTDIFDNPKYEKVDKLYSIEDEIEETEVTVVPVIFNQPNTPKPLKQALEFGSVGVPEEVSEETIQITPSVYQDAIESVQVNTSEEETSVVKDETDGIELIDSVGVFKTDEQQEELYEETAFQDINTKPSEEELELTKKYDTINEKEIVGGILEKVEEVDEADKQQANTEEVAALKKVKEKKEKTEEVVKERLGFNWFFWLSFVIVMVPIGFFGWILYSASTETHVPILGSRLDNSISNHISDTQVANVQSSISKIEGVQKTVVTLNVATLRITIDVEDTMAKEDIVKMAEDVYNIVNSEMPVYKYFTGQGSYKQYDLEVNLYNNLDAEDLIIVTLSKNTKMENYSIQVVTDAKNETLAEKLRGTNE